MVLGFFRTTNVHGMVASWLDTTHQDDAGISWTSGSTGQLVSKICSWCLIDSSGTVEHPHSLRLTGTLHCWSSRSDSDTSMLQNKFCMFTVALQNHMSLWLRVHKNRYGPPAKVLQYPDSNRGCQMSSIIFKVWSANHYTIPHDHGTSRWQNG